MGLKEWLEYHEEKTLWIRGFLILILICLLTRKDDGLIVALSDNLERPIVGQSGTFVEPGSANLISFQVEES